MATARKTENLAYTPTNYTQAEQRHAELGGWDEAQARRIAQNEGLEISAEHVTVLHYLRDYYVNQGWPKQTHLLSQQLDEAFAPQGGTQYLYRLFPGGPVAQGVRLAGLPELANATDESFGSSQ